MTRQIVNIGSTGNDGTGDAIRDAFNKINANFSELYAAQGLEAGIRFETLANIIKPFQPNSLLTIQKNADGSISVNNRVLVSSDGYLSINYDNNSSQIQLTAGTININRDPNPTLSNDLNAANHRLTALASPQSDQDAVTQKWVYDNFLDRNANYVTGGVTQIGASTMLSNFKVIPTPNNGNVLLTGNNRYQSLVAADGSTAKQLDLSLQGTDDSHAVRKDYADSKISLAGTNAIDPSTGLRNIGAGTMTGPLLLSADPQKTDPGLQAATKNYVDSKSFNSPTNLFVSTSGRDDLLIYTNGVPSPNPAYNSGLGYPIEQIGRSQAKAFRTLSAAAKYARYLQSIVDLQNSPYSVLSSAITPYRPAYNLGGTTTRVKINLANHGFITGDYVDVKGAISTAGQVGGVDTTNLNGVWKVFNVFSSTGVLDVNNFIIDLGFQNYVLWANPQVVQGGSISISLANKKDGPYTQFSKVGRGFSVNKFEITIFIESGIYSEQYPINIPVNTAVKGDEFRRTIIRPAPGPASSENANLIFVRGDRTVSSTNWQTAHYYHQLATIVSAQVNAVSMTISGAAYKPKPGQRFYISGGAIAGNGVGTQYRVTDATYIDPAVTPGTLPGTYTLSVVDDQYDPKPLEATLASGSTIEFFLDNEHCDVFLVNDAHQSRNVSFFGHKGNVMAFDPAGQILTRSPYGQVCASFSASGGGGQFIDGAAGNQYVTVNDVTYNDGLGNTGATGQYITIKNALRPIQVPNTFYYNKKKYVIIAATTPDSNGQVRLTLSSTTPIAQDDTYLPAGYIPINTQILIETAGNRSMLSNDFTMLNDLGYGILADNNGVTESVSQFTYYCAVSYWAKNGAQVRSVTGSSCYGLIGLQAEGSNPNESIQVANLTHDIVTPFTPWIDDPTSQGINGSTSLLITNLNYPPLRNATFELDQVNITISNIVRQTPTLGNLTPPLLVTTAYKHPFLTGQTVKFINVGGLAGTGTPVNNGTFTITYVNSTQFTLNYTDSTQYTSDMTQVASTAVQPTVNAVLTLNAKSTTITIKGDPSDQNFTGIARFDGVTGENTTSSNVLKVYALQYPAVVNMKFTLSTANPAINSATTQVYKVTSVDKKVVTFQCQTVNPSDNKIGSTTLVVTSIVGGMTPKAGWSFQLLDPSLGSNLNYTRYTVTAASANGSPGFYNLTITPALSVNMVNQQAGSGNVTIVDGIYDLTLDRNLLVNIPSSGTETITFYNAVWSISLNPSLDTSFGLQTSNWGNGTSGYTKKYLLYMQKSVAMTQVLNNPQIILSSALQYGSSNSDTTVYRIIGKNQSSSKSTAVFRLAAQATPNLGLFPNAKTAIVNNTNFLINEAVAYVNYTYPTLTYNATKCARDVGYVLSAIEQDITVGGATNSIAAGRAYWSSGLNVLGSLGQVSPEVAALNYVKTLFTNVLNETAASNLKQPALVTQTTSGTAGEAGAGATLQTLLQIVDNTVLNGYNFQNAAALLTANKSFIAAEVIAYINSTYPSLVYTASTYNTQLQAIVQALATDIVNGNAAQITTQAQAYFNGTGVLQITGPQQIAYIDAFKTWFIPTMTSVITNQTATTKQANISQTIVPATVAETGSLNQSIYLLTSLINNLQYSEKFPNAATNLTANSGFIKAELISYINSTYVTGQTNPISYNRVAFGTQMTNLVTALASDLSAGGAANTGNFVLTTYFTGGSSNVGTFFFNTGNPVTGPLDATLNALKSFIPNIVSLTAISGSAYGATKQVFYPQIINSGLVAETTAGTSLVTGGSLLTVQNLITDTINILQYGYNYTNAQSVLAANRAFIQAEVIAYLSTTYTSFSYNTTKCSRDVGLIVDAVTNDLIYGGNSNSVAAALAYYVGGVLQVPGNQLTPTVAAINQINQIAQAVLLNSQASPWTNLQSAIAQTYLLGTTVETNAGTLFAQNITTIANIVQNGGGNAPTLTYTNNVQTLTFGPDATDLYYGGILTGTNIIGPVNSQDTTPATFIRASQLDPLGTGNHIVKISQAVGGTIAANTEITVTGPGYDFIFDFNTGMQPQHVAGEQSGITTTFSTVRATAHDFLEVGTGGFDDSNYPHNIYGQAVNSASSGAIVKEVGTGRVFHVSTDQDGNFRVGTYFNVNQGDGSVSLQANINLTNVSGLGFTSGAIVNQFSTDPKMGGTSPQDNIVSTQKALVSYIAAQISGKYSDNTTTTNKGLMTLDGSSIMQGNLQVNGHTVEGVVNSTDVSGLGAVNRKYVDNVFAGGTINYGGSNSITTTGSRTNVQAFSMIADTFGPGGTLGNYGALALNNNKIIGVRNPTLSTDAATKGYVDAAIATGGNRTGWYGFTLTSSPSLGVTGFGALTGGSGYTSIPRVTVSGVGTGAVIEAVLTGTSVSGLTIVNPGYGYASAPTVVIGGSIYGATVLAGGSNYANNQTITFSPPSTSGGITATGTVTVVGGVVTGVTITDPGSGYTAVPTITFANQGNGATATANIDIGTGVVTNTFTVTSGGTGYSSQNPPTVTLLGGGGSGATATAIVSITGAVTAITLVLPGSGYTSAPQVVIGAKINLSLSAGTGASVASVTVGYPQVSINMSSNRITNLPDPGSTSLYNQDPVTLNYLNNNLKLSKLTDVTVTGSPNDTDILMFTGTGTFTANVTLDRTTVSTLPGNDTSTGSHINLVRTGNSFQALLVTGAITNAHVRATAAIDQTKLSLNAAPTTNTVPTSFTQNNLGLSTFNSSAFTSTFGYIDLLTASSTTTGITANKLAWIPSLTILGNTTNNTGAVSAVSLSNLATALNIPSVVANSITDSLLQNPGGVNKGAVLNQGSTLSGVTVPISGTIYFQHYASGGSYDNSTIGWQALMPGHPSNVVGGINGASTLYDIGSATAKWGTIYCHNIVADSVTGGASVPAVAQTVQGSLSPGSTDITMSTSAGSIGSYNGQNNTTISLNSVAGAATANTIVKRDANGGIFAQNLYATGQLQTQGSGAYTSNFYPLIYEDASLGARYTAIARRDYQTKGSATSIGIRVSSDQDNNNYYYAQYHVFDSYAQNRSNGQSNGAAYIDTSNAYYHGTATAALYADLAEKYLPDAEYDEGTVVVFGGGKEITVSSKAYDRRIAGVISLKPAFMMNKELEGGVYVALTGRVPCKVIGKVRKGDLMVTSEIPGVARAGNDDLIKVGTVLGKALSDYDSDSIGTIEVVVGKS
jgi:hypothetical protein